MTTLGEEDVPAPIGGLLDERSVVGYLAARDLVDTGTAQARALAGGVSSNVLLVTDASRAVVVKQALPRLRVAAQWDVPTDRSLTEAAALEFAGRLTPHAVPALVSVDAERHVLVVQAAPPDWTDWKTRLLASGCDAGGVAIARRLGDVLRAWQAFAGRLPDRVEDGYGYFEKLRIDPFLAETARRRPDTADLLYQLIERTQAERTCFVHGDFSCKNILSGRSAGPWVIDFEVAHRGHPAFDPAFLLCHLVMKWVHLPASRAALADCMRGFAGALSEAESDAASPHWADITGYLGALLLGRVAGKSPAGYLSPAEAGDVWEIGLALLRAGVDGTGGGLDLVLHACAGTVP